MPIKKCVKNGKSGYTVGNAKWCITYKSGDEASRKKAKQQAIKRWYAFAPNEVKKELSKNSLFEDSVENDKEMIMFASQWPKTLEDYKELVALKELYDANSSSEDCPCRS